MRKTVKLCLVVELAALLASTQQLAHLVPILSMPLLPCAEKRFATFFATAFGTAAARRLLGEGGTSRRLFVIFGLNEALLQLLLRVTERRKSSDKKTGQGLSPLSPWSTGLVVAILEPLGDVVQGRCVLKS